MRVLQPITNITKTSELAITKPIGSLVIYTDDTLAMPNTVTITVFVERATGDNTELLTRIPLVDFLLLQTYGTSSIYKRNVNGTSFNTIGLCELTPTGAIHLNDNERIKVSLDGLNPNKTYMIDGLEEPFTTNEIFKFEKKSCLVGEETRKFNVLKFDHVVFSNPDAINELVVEYDNGRTNRFTYDELVATSIDIDPIVYLDGTINVIHSVPEKLVFPLVAVREIEVIKQAGELVNMTFVGDELANLQ